MKTKEEILKMTKMELEKYKNNKLLNSHNFYYPNCSHCSDCYDCYNCSDVMHGLYCKNLHLGRLDENKYYICNIEISKEEFEQKKLELHL